MCFRSRVKLINISERFWILDGKKKCEEYNKKFLLIDMNNFEYNIENVNNNDFDLQQFGIFLSADTIYMTFHLNDTIAYIGRKLMSGDVLELQHKKDYYPLNADIPAVLKRFYVVQDATYAAEGFSPTWWPHLWRIKMSPLVDSQEYKDILDNPKAFKDYFNCKVSIFEPDTKSTKEFYPNYKIEEVFIPMPSAYESKYIKIEQDIGLHDIFRNPKTFYNGARRASNKIDDDRDAPKIKWITNFFNKNKLSIIKKIKKLICRWLFI